MWNIFLQNWVIYEATVSKYSIHGACEYIERVFTGLIAWDRQSREYRYRAWKTNGLLYLCIGRSSFQTWHPKRFLLDNFREMLVRFKHNIFKTRFLLRCRVDRDLFVCGLLLRAVRCTVHRAPRYGKSSRSVFR